MEPADRVIQKFGGQTALARALGKGQSTVQHWSKTGQIPAKWHGTLLQLATVRSIDLRVADLVEIPEADGGQKAPPLAMWSGELIVGEGGIPCHVLDDGRRVISRTGATKALTGGKASGDLESYLRTRALAPYLPAVEDRMVEFVMPGVVNKTARGMSAEDFLDLCTAYVRARDDGALVTERQVEIAAKAGMFLAACAKVGLIALIDEATGYQYDRAQDALQVKLKLYLAEEMRQWEKTFPDELWKEFGRLTGWSGKAHSRPKYWGKLVMELVYDYLDKDVADWLRNHAPEPRHGRNYHQWLSSQYGLKKLVEHLWMLIGMASACQSLYELRTKMAEKFGRQPIQFTLFVDPPRVHLLPAPKAARS